MPSLVTRSFKWISPGPQSLVTAASTFRVLRWTRRRAVATHVPRYEHISDVERLDGYRPGGYHPVRLNDRLHGRYSIVEKLGHGSYSTIWLARDERLDRYVAVKVGIADCSSKEAQTLEQILESPKNDLSDHLIAPVYERFRLRGPNGTHPCLVTTPARCSLVEALDDYDMFPLDAAGSLAAQLVMAVARVHTAGFVHGGQLYPHRHPEMSLTPPRHPPRQPAPPAAGSRN